jgi:hypothetical protein
MAKPEVAEVEVPTEVEVLTEEVKPSVYFKDGNFYYTDAEETK